MCLTASVLGFGRKLPSSSRTAKASLSLSLSLSWLAPYTLLSFLARCGNLFPHDHKIMPLPPPSASATSVPLDDSLWIDPWFWYAAVPSLGPGGGAEGDDDGKE